MPGDIWDGGETRAGHSAVSWHPFLLFAVQPLTETARSPSNADQISQYDRFKTVISTQHSESDLQQDAYDSMLESALPIHGHNEHDATREPGTSDHPVALDGRWLNQQDYENRATTSKESSVLCTDGQRISDTDNQKTSTLLTDVRSTTQIKDFQALRSERSNLSYCLLRYREEVKVVRLHRNKLVNVAAKLQQELQKNPPGSKSFSLERVNSLIESIQQANTNLAESDAYLDTVEYAVIAAEREMKQAEDQIHAKFHPDSTSEGPDILKDVLNLDKWSNSDTSSIKSWTDLEPQLRPNVFAQHSIRQGIITSPIQLVNLDEVLLNGSMSSSPDKSVPSEALSPDASDDGRGVSLARMASDNGIAVDHSGVQFPTSEVLFASTLLPMSGDLLQATSAQVRKREADLAPLLSGVESVFDAANDINRSLNAASDLAEMNTLVNGIEMIISYRSWLDFSRFLEYIPQSYKMALELLEIDSRLREVTISFHEQFSGESSVLKVGESLRSDRAKRNLQHPQTREPILCSNEEQSSMPFTSDKQSSKTKETIEGTPGEIMDDAAVSLMQSK